MTAEELKELVTGQPELIDELIPVVMPKLSEKGFIVRNQESEKSFLDSYIQRHDVRKGIIEDATSKIHTAYDKDYLEIFGEERPQGVKTYEAYKRKIAEIRQSQVSDPVAKEQIETLRNQLRSKETEFETQLNEIKTKHFVQKRMSLTDLVLEKVNVAIPITVKTDEEKQSYVSKVKTLIKNDFINGVAAKEDNDGNIIFYDGDKPLINQTDGKALTALEIIQQRNAYLIAKQEDAQPQGSGSGRNQNDSKTFKSREDVMAHLIAKGLIQGSKQFTDEYRSECTKSGLIK